MRAAAAGRGVVRVRSTARVVHVATTTSSTSRPRRRDPARVVGVVVGVAVGRRREPSLRHVSAR
jgi:hypothetical protein